jgi:hypothetical protein
MVAIFSLMVRFQGRRRYVSGRPGGGGSAAVANLFEKTLSKLAGGFT